ncbi:MAG: hypothetical protein DRI89_03100 [Bacteroidetes bacterium]|nr:MAG: hypothetical protein DRI89_03100 [Bacteroidota bacterium]
MGIIQKQTIKGSIYSYLGVGMGYLNVVILMPQLFTTEQVGLTQILLSISAIFSLIGSLGFSGVINRLFPYFRNVKTGHNGFSFLLTFTGLLGFSTVLVAFFILKPHIVEANIEKSPLLIEYLYFLIPLIFFRLFFILLDGYNKILLDALTGTFWMDFGYKALNFLFIVLFSFGILNFRQYMFGFTFAISFPALPVLYKLIKKGHFNLRPQFDSLNNKMLKQIFEVSTYGLLGSSSAIIVINIDRIMINEYLALGATGIFSVCALFGTIIKIPFVSLNKISTAFLAEAWKSNNLAEIKTIYYKSTINQMAFATLLFVGIFGNIDNIFRILPNIYEQGRNVVIIYSLAFLVLTAAGSGGFIIGTSHKYKIQTYFSFLTVFLTIGFNIIFIPWLGMDGAAYATLLTYLLSVIFRILFLKFNMNLFPFSYKHLLILIIGAISFLPSFFIEPIDNLILDIFIRSSIIGGIFILLIVSLNISEEINGIIKPFISRIIK